ncbi:MAG: hypothetical protein WCV73_04205 [Patescibacteria group bacterium]|jgi:hypothetical protein
MFESLKIWQTVELGTNLTIANDFIVALRKAGVRIETWAEEMIRHPAFTVSSKKKIRLTAPTVAELGFIQRTPLEHVYRRGNELRLLLCPAEAGLKLRLQYLDQPIGETVHIAMVPIFDLDEECKGIFSLKCDAEGPVLNVTSGLPEHQLQPEDRVVFALPPV